MGGSGKVVFVYRFGSATNDALTPRSKDTVSEAGSKPGLSVELSPPPTGGKAQLLDVSLLVGTGLAFFADDVQMGGREGHGVIAPVNDAGDVDQALLLEWAACRGTQNQHRFTQAILNAIVDPDSRRNS